MSSSPCLNLFGVIPPDTGITGTIAWGGGPDLWHKYHRKVTKSHKNQPSTPPQLDTSTSTSSGAADAWMPPPEPGCNHPQAASYNPLFPNKWKEFNNRQLSRCHCGAEAWIIIFKRHFFSPPLDSFGCYCCNLKLVSSVKRSRLLCNWSWAGYWWLVSGRWQPIKTIDWGSSRVQPMGDNKSITNNGFPNQVICHQSPGGFTGSLLAANTNQAAPSWDTVQLSSLTRAYSYSMQSSQDSSTT